MTTLPAKYRIPTSMIRYTIFAAVVTAVVIYLVPRGMGLPSRTSTGITVAGLVVIALMVGRILRLGTVVTTEGVIRRGFLADRHHAWSDIHEFALIDREVVHVAYGFQVSSRYVVTVAVGPQRRRKTLLFLDERGFSSVDRFRDELNTVAASWDRRRGA